MKKLKSPEDFGIAPGHLVEVQLDGEEPHRYPAEYVLIEPTALVVGDELGMRVASYPYERYYQREDGTWYFEHSRTGNYVLRQGPRWP